MKHDFRVKEILEAEASLQQLATAFLQTVDPGDTVPSEDIARNLQLSGETVQLPPNLEEKYRALVEQIPAVVFMAYLDKGIGEAYVSPQIEQALGFTQREWLEDPVRWYQQIHPADKLRWS